MHPIDKAKALKQMYEKYGTNKRVSKESGFSIPTIRRYLQLLDLAPTIQGKLTTSEGPAGVGTLSKLATTFSSHYEQELALERISGFNQKVQLEILKRSKGDISKIDELKEQALEGVLDTHLCHGIHECNFIPDKLKKPIDEIIRKSKSNRKLTSSLINFLSVHRENTA